MSVVPTSYHSKGLGGYGSLAHIPYLTPSLPHSLPSHFPTLPFNFSRSANRRLIHARHAKEFDVLYCCYSRVRAEMSQFPIPLCPSDVTVICEVYTNSPRPPCPSPLHNTNTPPSL